MSGDLSCDHGTLLAAWCSQCASEWVPETLEPATSDRSQNAA